MGSLAGSLDSSEELSVYPNPFNPTTTFTVTLAEPNRVKLQVYNLLGQLVKELANGQTEAGVHTYTFNAANLASGTYFYRLQIGEKIQKGKISLVK